MADKLSEIDKRDLARFSTKHRVDENGCWRWTAGKMRYGYGQFHSHKSDGTKQNERAHRFSFRIFNGPLIEGLVIDHICNVRDCVNPAHLRQVTNRENVLRGVGHTAVNARKTHCKEGHELVEENLYRLKGQRLCRKCRRADRLWRNREDRAKAREKSI